MLLLPLAALAALAASPDAIATAYVRGDLDEVARLGAQLGAAGIAPLLVGPIARAGIAAAPAAPDGWELLLDLATGAGSWDRHRAAPAARAAVAIARRLDADTAIAGELPDDALAARQAAWLAIAERPDRWADVRVHALEVVARLARARRATSTTATEPGFDLATVLADEDPEVRRAACELVPAPAPPALVPVLAAAVGSDTAPTVVLAAGQALCGELADGAGGRVVLDALGESGLARLRAVIAAPLPPDAPPPAALDAARCLVAAGGADNLAAVRGLAFRAPAPLRAPLARLLR
jgi:hypothetical protein